MEAPDKENYSEQHEAAFVPFKKLHKMRTTALEKLRDEVRALQGSMSAARTRRAKQRSTR